MSLARTALRLATIAALQGADGNSGPTIANNRVYDSRIDDFSPETFPADALPTVIVLTDDDEGEALSHQNGGPPFRRMIKLVLEFAMVQGFDVPVESGGTAFVPGYPATDAEHEASLDFLEFQIAQRLASGLDALPILWRQISRPWKRDCHRQVLDDSGVKIAARVMTWDCEVSDDQLQIYDTSGVVPTGLDIFPDPMRTVAKALPQTSNGYKIALALANALSPVTAGSLNGIDFTFDDVDGQDLSDMFDVTLEIRSALDVEQIVATGAIVTIDYAKGTFQNLILAANVSAISIINWPPTGKTGRLIVQITNTGNFSLAGWPNTEWVAGVAPVITQGAGKKDILVLTTASSGAEVFGNIIGQDYH